MIILLIVGVQTADLRNELCYLESHENVIHNNIAIIDANTAMLLRDQK